MYVFTKVACTLLLSLLSGCSAVRLTQQPIPHPGLIRCDFCRSSGFVEDTCNCGVCGSHGDCAASCKPGLISSQMCWVAPAPKAHDACTAEVQGATYRNSAWRRAHKCKCADGFGLVGSDRACGDGTDRYFALGALVGKNCTCSRYVLVGRSTALSPEEGEFVQGPGYGTKWKWLTADQRLVLSRGGQASVSIDHYGDNGKWGTLKRDDSTMWGFKAQYEGSWSKQVNTTGYLVKLIRKTTSAWTTTPGDKPQVSDISPPISVEVMVELDKIKIKTQAGSTYPIFSWDISTGRQALDRVEHPNAAPDWQRYYYKNYRYEWDD